MTTSPQEPGHPGPTDPDIPPDKPEPDNPTEIPDDDIPDRPGMDDLDPNG